jgi:hypothetical protein
MFQKCTEFAYYQVCSRWCIRMINIKATLLDTNIKGWLS